jgi:hypothetical protein
VSLSAFTACPSGACHHWFENKSIVTVTFADVNTSWPEPVLAASVEDIARVFGES